MVFRNAHIAKIGNLCYTIEAAPGNRAAFSDLRLAYFSFQTRALRALPRGPGTF
jgi:hypothetical protein